MSTKKKTVKKLKAPKGFRFLRKGEVIRLNDKWLNFLGQWCDEVPSDMYQKVGVKWNSTELVPYCRAIKKPAPKQPRAKAVKKDVWTYSEYRATLRKNGKAFAIVTPDGKNALPIEASLELLALLNKA